MRTRAARQLDLLSIKSLAGESAVSLLSQMVFDDTPSLVKATLLPGGEKLWLAEDESGILGFTHARPRRFVLGWEMVRLQLRQNIEPDSVVSGLVHEVLQHLQESGIPRLFARAPADSVGHEILLGCGFTHLLSECLYGRQPQKTSVPDETPIGMRYRLPQDAWPLRQLENAQTPVLVSQLEGLTALSWSTPPKRAFRKGEPTELVVEREGELVAWIGWTPAGGGPGSPEHVRLGLLTQNDDLEMADALLDYGLHAIAAKRPHAGILLRLRDYQLALEPALLDHGFMHVSKDTLHIKHGRLQLVPRRLSRFFDLAPRVRTLSLEPGRE